VVEHQGDIKLNNDSHSVSAVFRGVCAWNKKNLFTSTKLGLQAGTPAPTLALWNRSAIFF